MDDEIEERMAMAICVISGLKNHKSFASKLKAIIDQYEEYQSLKGYTIDGELAESNIVADVCDQKCAVVPVS